MGNTAEENSALRGMAGRIVEQQLAAEPAPGAIDVTLSGSGKVLTFTRGANGWVVLALLLLVAVTATLAFPRRMEVKPKAAARAGIL